MDSKTPGGCDVVLKLPSTLLHPLCLKVTAVFHCQCQRGDGASDGEF